MNLIKKYFLFLFNSAFSLNERHIQQFATKYGKGTDWLDLGCDDGSWTKRITSKKVNWFGLELVEDRVKIAKKNGIYAKVGSLEKKLPFSDSQFDLVHSNQVIEHLFDLDLFLSEIHRVLKPNGIHIISTENPASWHNIFALLMGWQMFSATNISSKKLGIGNPFAIHGGKGFSDTAEGRTDAWEHNKLLTPKALSELLSCHGFEVINTVGAGYHPLPSMLGEMNPSHSHFYAIVSRKKVLKKYKQ